MLKMRKSSAAESMTGTADDSKLRGSVGGKRVLNTLKAMFQRSESRTRTTTTRKQQNTEANGRSTSRRSARTALTSLGARGGNNNHQVVEDDFPIKWVTVPMVEEALSPCDYLKSRLEERGYSAAEISNSNSGYRDAAEAASESKNEESQQKQLLEAIRNDNVERIGELMASSVSAEFPYSGERGEASTLHSMCRRGQAKALQQFLQAGANLEIFEGYGLSALHAACWCPTANFDVIDVLLEHDKNLLFVHDDRGCTPLYYVRGNHWPAWREYIDAKMEQYWPDQKCEEETEATAPIQEDEEATLATQSEVAVLA